MHTTLRLIIMILIALSPSLLMADSRQDLLPRPAHVSPQEGALRLEPSFCVNQEGPASPRVTAALFRTLRRLSGRTGLMFAQDPQDGPPHAESPTLNVRYRQGGRLDVGTDESYVLSITPSRADLEAPTDLGILRGLESFLQLLEPDGAAYRFPSVRIAALSGVEASRSSASITTPRGSATSPVPAGTASSSSIPRATRAPRPPRSSGPPRPRAPGRSLSSPPTTTSAYSRPATKS